MQLMLSFLSACVILFWPAASDASFVPLYLAILVCLLCLLLQMSITLGHEGVCCCVHVEVFWPS